MRRHSFVAALVLCMAAVPAWGQGRPRQAEEKKDSGDSEDNPVLARLSELEKKALDAFNSYSYRTARKVLQQALTEAEDARLQPGPALARIHLLLGIDAVAGSNDLYRGLYEFATALRMDHSIQIPRELLTPQLAQMLKKAKKAIKAVGKPPVLDVASEAEASSGPKVRKPGQLGLVHVPVDMARRGLPIPIKAEAGIDVQAHKMVLYYRPAGTVKFVKVTMKKNKGVFRASIPPKATMGRYIHYYLEAYDKRGRKTASKGSPKSPIVIILTNK